MLADLLAARIRDAATVLIERGGTLTSATAPQGGYTAAALRPLLADLIRQAVIIDLHIGPGIDAVTTAIGVSACTVRATYPN